MQRITDAKTWLAEQIAKLGRIQLPARRPRRGRYRLV
jgi:hypothetical protein